MNAREKKTNTHTLSGSKYKWFLFAPSCLVIHCRIHTFWLTLKLNAVMCFAFMTFIFFSYRTHFFQSVNQKWFCVLPSIWCCEKKIHPIFSVDRFTFFANFLNRWHWNRLFLVLVSIKRTIYRQSKSKYIFVIPKTDEMLRIQCALMSRTRLNLNFQCENNKIEEKKRNRQKKTETKKSKFV